MMNAVAIVSRTAWAFLLMILLAAAADAQQRRAAAKPAPDLADVSYGPHPRNVLDFWKAVSERPTPLVVFIHGGGFRGGSKEALSAGLLDGLLAKGISVIAINYRLSPEVSFPAHFTDCARAIQFARTKAKEWNFDVHRVGATGGSAGAGTSLWLGFRDDLAEPNHADVVLRQSTRLSCMAVQGAQSSYDPRVIREWIGDSAARHPALEGFYGLKPDELDTPRAHKLYEAASAINYLTKDDPPVYAFYSEGRVLPPDARPGQGIHHINFGLRLKKQMDKLGIECTVRHRDEGVDAEKEIIEFFTKHLRPGGQAVNTEPQVSQRACPPEMLSATTADQQTASAVIRKPPGKGPFPTIVFLHGGLQARNPERMLKTTPSQPTNNRFLAAGYVTVEAAFRSRSDDPQTKDALLDCLAIIAQVKKMPEVDPRSVVVFGHSGGGSLALELAGETELCAVVAGEPASILFTGMYNVQTRRRDQRNELMEDPKRYYTPEVQEFTRKKIARIACPVLIVHGDQHPINKINNEIIIPELKAAGKKVESILYPGEPHTFVFGREGSPEAARKCFADCHAFLKKRLPTEPVPLEASLVTQIPIQLP